MKITSYNAPSENQTGVTGTWDLTKISSLTGVSSDGKSVLSNDVVVPATTDGGAVLTLLANKSSKPKFNKGLQMNTGSKAFEVATVKGAAGKKLTVVCENASSNAKSSSGTVNAIEISFGNQSFKWTDGSTVTNSTQTLTYTLENESVTISGSGVKIKKVTVE